jgi:hypothetical protein
MRSYDYIISKIFLKLYIFISSSIYLFNFSIYIVYFILIIIMNFTSKRHQFWREKRING